MNSKYRINRHEIHHAESPTWCIHCGTFDRYCSGLQCVSARTGKFDSRITENFERMAMNFFGKQGVTK
jgi:hypothetical protein